MAPGADQRGEGGLLSTSALAKKLHLPIQQLFATLRDYGWIERSGDHWLLTPKGEFEGGAYQNSKRFGRYVVWPETLATHPLLAAIESRQRITARGMRRYYPQLHPQTINRALAELGLQEHTLLGWELTELGRRFGGQQEESEDSGALYVSWPHEIIDEAVVHRELGRFSEHGAPRVDDSAEPDLFASSGRVAVEGYAGIDGHVLHSPLQMHVCNWLYLAQLTHAHARSLPVDEPLCADFYLPAGRIYIDCWEADVPAGELSGRLRKRDIYEQLGLRSIEINARDESRLDEVLGRRLLEFGLRF
jgi:hypothetical protein